MINFIKAQLSDWRMIIKYVISGSIAATIQLSVLAYLVESLNFWHIKAVVIACVVSSTVAFVLQKFWTFKDRSMNKAHFQMTSYIALAFSALLLNVFLMYIFVDILGLWYIFGQVITMGLVVMVVFLCNKYIIFNRDSVLFQGVNK